jgi:hypothetical protein
MLATRRCSRGAGSGVAGAQTCCPQAPPQLSPQPLPALMAAAAAVATARGESHRHCGCDWAAVPPPSLPRERPRAVGCGLPNAAMPAVTGTGAGLAGARGASSSSRVRAWPPPGTHLETAEEVLDSRASSPPLPLLPHVCSLTAPPPALLLLREHAPPSLAERLPPAPPGAPGAVQPASPAWLCARLAWVLPLLLPPLL